MKEDIGKCVSHTFDDFKIKVFEHILLHSLFNFSHLEISGMTHCLDLGSDQQHTSWVFFCFKLDALEAGLLPQEAERPLHVELDVELES